MHNFLLKPAFYCRYYMASRSDTRTCLLDKWTNHVPVCERQSLYCCTRFKARCPSTEISSLRSLLCFVSIQMRPPTCRWRGGRQRDARKRAGRSSRPLSQIQLRDSWEAPEWQLYADLWEKRRVGSSIPNVRRWELEQ